MKNRKIIAVYVTSIRGTIPSENYSRFQQPRKPSAECCHQRTLTGMYDEVTGDFPSESAEVNEGI